MSAAQQGLLGGQELDPIEIPPISRTTLALFAGASGDHNPMHIDIDVARSGGLDDVFAHGMLSMAYLGRALTAWFPGWELIAFSSRFTAVTPVLGQPTCRASVAEVGDDGLTTAVDLRLVLADGTQTILGRASLRRRTP